MTLIRRAILALALIAGGAPAIAQVPPPVPALPDAERRTSYSITASQCSCAVNFQLYGDGVDYAAWVEVFINGTRVNFNDATFGWTITVPTQTLATRARPITDAVLTFNSAQTGTVQIVGARRPRQTSQFSEGGVTARALNQRLTDSTAILRELWDKTNDVTGRALLSAPGNIIGRLPSPAVCASALLGFDATGSNPLCLSSGGAGNVILPTIAGNLACFADVTGRLQNCAGLSLVLSQNAATAAFITNTNPGTNALAVWSATNANGTASFGVGGANYTGSTILQNRAYVDAQSGLGGIAINNQGANPIVFGISNTEVARITGTKGITLAPAFQSANIGNAAVYGQLANPANGYTGNYTGALFSLGTPIPAAEQYGNNVVPMQQSLVATGVIASGDVGLGNIISGYCRTDAPDPAICVGVLGQSGTSVNGSNLFGLNGLAQNIHAPSTAGFNVNYLAAVEFNPNFWQISPGVNPTASQNHFYGINIQGGGNHTNEIGSAITINNSAFPATTRWANGVELIAGCCITGVSIGPVALGNSQASQTLSLTGTDAGGVAHSATVKADLAGNLVMNPATAGAIALADPSSGTIFSTSSSFGGSGVRIAALTTAGVLTNSATTGQINSVTTLPSGLTAPALTVTSSFTATGLVTNASLANPATTVNGQTCTLGSTCTVTATSSSTLTFGTHLTSGGASYNGSAPITITSDATNANTASTIVARDGSGNFVAGTITASLTGHASLDLAVSALGTGVQTALGVNIGSAGAPVLFNGALGSPSSAGTIPAFTLGGTLAGGGNQINNVIIGSSTPLAGSFTTASASTSVTSPLHIGGSGTTGTQLTLQTTSGVGTTDAFAFKGGNNGATTFATLQTGSFNLQSGSTYSINGTSVLSGSTLGSGVTASSLTSLGTLSSLTVSGAVSLTNNAAGGQLFGGTSSDTGQTYFQFGNTSVGGHSWQFATAGSTIGVEVGGFYFYDTTAGKYRALFSQAGNTIIGSYIGPALATSATDGFIYIPTSAGTPTGVPTAYTGHVALLYDTTNHQFWIYDGGWKQPKTPAGAALVTWQ